MCGRYVSVQSDNDLTEEFEVEEVVGDPPGPSWNVAPTDPVRVVVDRRPRTGDGASTRQLRTVRWGLVPSWATSRSGGTKLINVRSESVAEKPAFRSAAARRRCLIPAAGYYEWQSAGKHKVPYYLHEPDGRTLAMAGLYELWRDRALPDDHPDRWLWTCSVITRPASDALGAIHDRCPVFVPSELREPWLDCSVDDPAVARDLLDAIPELHLAPRIVGPAVGNVRNNGPELIEPAPATA